MKILPSENKRVVIKVGSLWWPWETSTFSRN